MERTNEGQTNTSVEPKRSNESKIQNSSQLTSGFLRQCIVTLGLTTINFEDHETVCSTVWHKSFY